MISRATVSTGVIRDGILRTAHALAAFHAPHAPDDDRLIRDFNEKLVFSGAQDRAIDARATRLIQAIRSESGQVGGVEDFLREYGLSTREGLALMVLAEALLRVPDALTQDKLIEDKLKEGGWSDHETHGDTWFVSASAWALAMSARVIKPGETPEAALIRELHEELGVETWESCLAPLTFASHSYDDFHLLMPVFVCRRWTGTVQAREGQEFAWVASNRLREYPMPAADSPLIPIIRDWV